MEERFTLSDAERNSPLWRRLMGHFEKRLAIHQRQNEDASKDHAATNVLRGRISEIRGLIALDKDQLPPM